MLDYAFNVLLIEILEDYSQVLERKEKIGEKNYSARMEAKHESTEICTKLHAQPNFNGAFKSTSSTQRQSHDRFQAFNDSSSSVKTKYTHINETIFLLSL